MVYFFITSFYRFILSQGRSAQYCRIQKSGAAFNFLVGQFNLNIPLASNVTLYSIFRNDLYHIVHCTKKIERTKGWNDSSHLIKNIPFINL